MKEKQKEQEEQKKGVDIECPVCGEVMKSIPLPDKVLYSCQTAKNCKNEYNFFGACPLVGMCFTKEQLSKGGEYLEHLPDTDSKFMRMASARA